MAEELMELHKHVVKAIGLVAGEYGYSKNFKQQLERIEKEEPKEALRDAKKGMRILRWVGRAERNVDREEKEIIDVLVDLKEMLPDNLQKEEEKLMKQLKVAHAKLLTAASMFRGDVRNDLLQIETDEQLLMKLGEDKGEKVKADLQRCFKEAEEGIDDLLKWLASTEAILKQIDGFEQRLENLS